jgi:choloylglycine hydrolase
MCTDLRLLNPGNYGISVRNLDYSDELDTWIGFVPSGTRFVSLTPPVGHGGPAFAWTSRHNYVNFIGLPAGLVTELIFNTVPDHDKAVSCEAMNDQGLAVASLWNDDTQFPDTSKNPDLPLLADFSLVEWLAGTFDTVAAVRAALTAAPPPFVIWGNLKLPWADWAPAPAHYVVHDAQGDDLVIEILDGVLTLLPSVAGVLTNEPRLSWHKQNLSNYANLSYFDPSGPMPVFPGVNVSPLGCGSGLLGLPGDFTPPSRFVRAAVLNLSNARRNAVGSQLQVIAHALHLADTVAPPFGLNHTENGADYTQWQVVRDHQARRYYIRTCFSTGLQGIDLTTVTFGTFDRSYYVPLGDVDPTVAFAVPEPPARDVIRPA